MAKRIPEDELKAIEQTVRGQPNGVTAQEIARALTYELPYRTLQYRLKHLADHDRLVKEGKGRWAKYRLPSAPGDRAATPERGQPIEATVPLSQGGIEVRAYLRRPAEARKPVGHDRGFLDAYRPNVTAYLTPADRARLRKLGTPPMAAQPAGTFARQVLSRLLIDLSWNSSRLEGNTYSLLDTRRLIEFGHEAEGRHQLEARMILNHKDAIEFLVGAAEDIGFNRYTILNLHAILANDLLGDAGAAGRLRRMAVGIEGSVFHPLEVPQLIEECFDQVLATAAAIADPFEQSFFVMVHLPYLQPFDDVNKRVSRLAANIPLIKGNLSPLSFTEVPRSAYTDAILGVYELNQVELLRDVYLWAYERSVERYAAIRQSLGEPDPFRLRYRSALRGVVAEIVTRGMGRAAAAARIATWARENIEEAARERFRELAEGELLGLHEGNFARYPITPAAFQAWWHVWSEKPPRP